MLFIKSPAGCNKRNISGFALIEVMVAFGLIAILTAIITSLFGDIMKQQKQANVSSTIESMRSNIQKLALDGTAWRMTVAASGGAVAGSPNDSLDCVQDNAACAVTAGVSANVMLPNLTTEFLDAVPSLALPQLMDATGVAYIDTSGAATAGYTDRGSPCNTFDSVNGNDACPIRWSLRIAYECQAPAVNCLNPTVRFIALLYYRPVGNSTSTAIVNESKYRLDLRRGAKGDARNEVFYAEYRGAAGGAVGNFSVPTNGGPCAAGGTAIPYNNTILNESANVTTGGAAVMQFLPGTYSCTASSSCFACGAVRLELRNVTDGAALGTSVSQLSAPWSQTQVSFSQVNFTINGTKNISVVQYCQTDPNGDATLTNLNLGVALPAYANQTKFSDIRCVRLF